MPLNDTITGRNLIIQITGEVDHHRAKELMQEMERKLELYCPSTLTLDLSGVTFMDSSGIAVLLRADRRMRETEGHVEVVGVPVQAGPGSCQAAGAAISSSPWPLEGRSEYI